MGSISSSSRSPTPHHTTRSARPSVSSAMATRGHTNNPDGSTLPSSAPRRPRSRTSSTTGQSGSTPGCSTRPKHAAAVRARMGACSRGSSAPRRTTVSAGPYPSFVGMSRRGAGGSVCLFVHRATNDVVSQVPLDPPSNAVHPSGVQGVAHVRLLVERDAITGVAAQLTSVVGEPP